MRQGFSLVELSIVLVILGLLTGGILGGQSLIKAAELRSVTTERQQWQTAINVFKGKYFALPGDMANASQFWGAAASGGGGTTCSDVISTDEATCDGNGDGNIELTEDGIWTHGYLRAWQHLANAGLITGTYTGTRHPDGTNHSTWHVIGWNIPMAKVSSSTGWGICASDWASFGRGERNFIILGAPGWTAETCGIGYASALSGQDAWQVDTKLDDGNPATGSITAIHGYEDAGCTSTGWDENVTTSDYLLDETEPRCLMFFNI